MTKSIFPAAFAAPMLAASLLAAAPAHADDDRARIIVTGEGEAAISPDMAILTIAVVREAETARAALDANNDAMTSVIDAMKEDGIESRDLQTGGLSINPRYVYPNDKNEEESPRIVGYEVGNTLTVRIRDLDKVGAVLDRSVTLGVNQGGGLSFTNDDPSTTVSEARKRAVQNAMDKARTLAEAAGVKLGDIIEISEQAQQRPPMPYAGKAVRMQASAEAVPVEAGENTYQVQVNVTFELDK
ncbi:SIMPL domain-containing protein [uncultured Nitratireductor sp.]|uniref:SIMPL domain-containing protein n=1 Tax=uncultured Nitratireductor sp. TaxID=520953 RepID=UPI0025CE14DA|nr:SIMPL domain-containing protein [uncultured Nitratireductor sp.]